MSLKDLPDSHDLGHLRAALRLFDGRGCAVDGGAHRGIWTRELQKHFVRVVSFEPRFEMADRIEPRPCDEVIIAALGEDVGRCVIAEGAENNGQAHVAAGNEVDIVPLDFYELDVDFLKLDVEGYELHALAGAARTIDRCRPAVMVECNGLIGRYGFEDKDVVDFLGARGYVEAGRWNKDWLFLAR